MNVPNRYSSLFAVVLFFCASVAHAQQPPPPPSQPLSPNVHATPSVPRMLPFVTVSNVSIVSQKGHVMNISFDLGDKSEGQPVVRYAVIAEVASSTGTYVVDQYVFPDNISFATYTQVHKNITYTAPADLVGMYSLYIEAANSVGEPLARALVGTVVFATSTSGIALSEPCSLYVKDANGASTMSMLFNGAVMKQTQTLTLGCLVKNFSAATTSVTPRFETRSSTPYGDTVEQTGGEVFTQSLAPYAQQQLLFVLPIATSPGLYNIAFSLASGKDNSNTKYVHYVVQGADATIQNITIDKDHYAQGDTAQAGFVWTAAVMSVGTSTTVFASKAEVILQDGAGNACADVLKQDITSGSSATAMIPVTRACTNPHVIIRVPNVDGSALTGTFATTTSVTASTTMYGISLRLLVMFGVGAAALIICIVLLVVVVKKRRARKNASVTNPPPSAYPPPAAQ